MVRMSTVAWSQPSRSKGMIWCQGGSLKGYGVGREQHDTRCGDGRWERGVSLDGKHRTEREGEREREVVGGLSSVQCSDGGGCSQS